LLFPIKVKLSIVIPTYKNAAALKQELPPFLVWLKEKFGKVELIIVDDGSNDGGATEAVAKENNCRFIGLPQNAGKGAAVRAGMLQASGDFRLFTDADIPYEYESVERFVHYLNEKEFHVAVGDRTLSESRYFSEIKNSRKFGSGIFTFFVGRFVTTGLFDTQCGLKGFSAAVANDLFSVALLNGFAFDVELLYISLKRNYDIKRLPVSFRSTLEQSSVSLLRHAPGMLFDLFCIKWNHVCGRYNAR
jgi:dolichyl-phosphate beta-glucosyltransferase